MRWCCGGGSGNSSTNLNNRRRSSDSDVIKPTKLMSETSFKTDKHLTKILKVRNEKGKNKTKNNFDENERNYFFKDQKNNKNASISTYEEPKISNVEARRGVLKSSLKLLQPRKSSVSRTVKGVQYADEVQSIQNKNNIVSNITQEKEKFLPEKKDKNFQFYVNNPQLNNTKNSDSLFIKGTNSFAQNLNGNSTQLSLIKQNYEVFNQTINNQQFFKYETMLIKACKTAIYINDSNSTLVVLQPTNFKDSNVSLQSCNVNTASTSTFPNVPILIQRLQTNGWTIYVTNQTNAVQEIHLRNPVLILIDKKIDNFSNFLTYIKSIPECEDILVCYLMENLPSDNSINFQPLFSYSSIDISLCETFARLSSRLRAIPALFAVIEEAEQPIKICDENNIAQYVNRAYEIVTGKIRSDVLGSDASDLREITHNHFLTDKQMNNASFELYPITNTNNLTDPTISISDTTLFPSNPNALNVLDNANQNGKYMYNNLNNVNRRRSSEWHCITVPTCSTMSSQFVYVKRGSADVIGRESLKGLKTPTALVEAPITEALHVLSNVLSKCNDEETQMQIRDAIKILSSTELYAPSITRFCDNDRIASGYYDGLIRLHQPPRQRKRSVVDAVKENQQRRVSGGSSISNSSLSEVCGNPARRRISNDVANALENENLWFFDVIELERITNYRPLSQIGVKIFERWNVAETLQCSTDHLKRWLQVIEANYQSGNAYHNATHAADVLQATSFFLNSDAVGQYIQDHHALSALIAATIHDLDHPGRGNAFLMNTRARLAILYNDHSVLENHHVALAFQLTLTQPGVNIFAKVPPDEFAQIRQAIIDMVLATDMSRHFEYLTKFQQIMAMPDVDENRDANSLTICRMMIKCADIANPTREWRLCYQWAMRIVVEYFEQTAEEMEKGLPLTMKGFDCETCNIPLTQCTFVDMFARETFTLWCEFAELPLLLTELETNYQKWKAQASDWDPKKNLEILQKRQGGIGR